MDRKRGARAKAGSVPATVEYGLIAAGLTMAIITVIVSVAMG